MNTSTTACHTPPQIGTRNIRYSWEWRTGSLIRETSYSGTDERGGCYGDRERATLLCLWGWTKPAPR